MDAMINATVRIRLHHVGRNFRFISVAVGRKMMIKNPTRNKIQSKISGRRNVQERGMKTALYTFFVIAVDSARKGTHANATKRNVMICAGIAGSFQLVHFVHIR